MNYTVFKICQKMSHQKFHIAKKLLKTCLNLGAKNKTFQFDGEKSDF